MDSTWFQFQNHADKDAGWGPYMTCDIWINSGSGSDKNTTTPNAASLITHQQRPTLRYSSRDISTCSIWTFMILNKYIIVSLFLGLYISTFQLEGWLNSRKRPCSIFFKINRRCSIFRIDFSRSLSPKKAWTPHKESCIYVIQFLLTTCWIFRNLNNLYFLNRHIYIHILWPTPR